jgi:hypothetical protein
VIPATIVFRPRTLAPILVIITLSSVLGVAMLTHDHDWGDDFAAYIMQAASIVHGTERQEVARAAFSIQQSSRYFGPVTTPWGFPVLLAPVYAVCGGLSIWCLKLVNLPLFALFVAAFWCFAASRLPRADALLLTSVFAFNPVLLAFENFVLSDLAFLFLSTLCIVLIDRVIVQPARPEGSRRGNVAIGVAAFLAFFVRANGVLLIPTLFATQLALYLRSRRSDHVGTRPSTEALVPYAVFVALAALAAMIFPGGGLSDAQHYRTLTAGRLLENVSAYLVIPSIFFWPIPLYELFYGALFPFLLCGLAWHSREDLPAVVFSGLTLLVFVFWPEQQGVRYIFPVLPFFVYFCYRGMKANAFALTERYRTAGTTLTRAVWIAVVVLFAHASIHIAGQRSSPAGGAFQPASVEMFDAIKTRTAPGDVVIFDKPRLMRLMTDRDAILVDRCDQLAKGRYVVVRKAGGATNQIAPDEIRACDPSLQLAPVFDNSQFIIYRIAPKRSA